MSAPILGTQNAGWHRFNVGALECTALWDGYIHHAYDGLFPNGDPEELLRLKQSHGLPLDHIPMDLNPVAVNTGEKLYLIDAGMGRASTMFGDKMGRLMESLSASGIKPEQIDAVLDPSAPGSFFRPHPSRRQPRFSQRGPVLHRDGLGRVDERREFEAERFPRHGPRERCRRSRPIDIK